MAKKNRGNRKVNLTPDVLQGLQQALNDSIRPEHREKKKDGKGTGKTQKRKPLDTGAQRSHTKDTV